MTKNANHAFLRAEKGLFRLKHFAIDLQSESC